MFSAVAPPSTRLRILGWYMVLVAVALVVGLLLQRSVLIAQLDDEVNEQLEQEVRELEQLVGGRDPQTGEPFGSDLRAVFNTFLSRNVPVEGEALFAIVDGRPYAQTVSELPLFDDEELVAQWAATEEPVREDIDTEAGPVRYLAVPVLAEDAVSGVFVVTFFMQSRLENIDRVLRTGILVYGSAFVVVSALAWFAAGRVLRPIRELTTTARTISDDEWSGRIDVQGNDELAELARTFNDMLDRLEDAFGTQRRFIDDAGHELRTPITIIRGHLELMGDDPHERAETMRLVMDELDRMARLVDDLLLIARAEHFDFLDPHPLDVAEFMEDIHAKAAPMTDHAWSLSEAPEVVVTADRQRLTQAMMNLARNAAEHSPPGSPIDLGAQVVGDEVRLFVRDQGEGIAPEDRDRIFERFSRGRAGRRGSNGAGLGLAIVNVIAEAHGGRVLVRSRPGAGSTFMVALPLDGYGPIGQDAEQDAEQGDAG